MSNMTEITTPAIVQTTDVTISNIKAKGKELLELYKPYIDGTVVITKDNVKEMKKFRTECNKDFEALEELRKKKYAELDTEKKKIDAEWKKHISVGVYNLIDSNLKKEIDAIEDATKLEKENEVRTLFDELVLLHKIDFIKFEKVGLKIGLNTSMKSLKDEVNQFIDKVVGDLALIDTQDHSERILVSYKQSLDATKSITEVLEVVKKEEDLRIKREAEQLKKDEAAERAVQQRIERRNEVFHAPVAEPLPKPVLEVIPEVEVTPIDEVMTITFTATDKRSKLIALREYMKAEGIKYE